MNQISSVRLFETKKLKMKLNFLLFAVFMFLGSLNASALPEPASSRKSSKLNSIILLKK